MGTPGSNQRRLTMKLGLAGIVNVLAHKHIDCGDVSPDVLKLTGPYRARHPEVTLHLGDAGPWSGPGPLPATRGCATLVVGRLPARGHPAAIT
jgi:hypothetical protein